MSRTVFSPRSWRVAAQEFDSVAAEAPSALRGLVSETTNAGACGAASGLATVDGAVAIMLEVFGAVMEDSILAPLEEGLRQEADAIADTGETLQAAEDHGADVASHVGH
ncbi:hypothetical protein [uncultured Tessaracoccus sp.]|uniref:hypothetical protein n=1 Tax=uncultured Tessaracoccus sp. TaxID=905023 RepID=UPI002600B774|nr:hypothetical protein [uncultured Tessaracoccus sp.]